MIRPGKKLIIVENEQSKRSTPYSIAFTENGREYGYNALKEQGKRPEQVLTFTHNVFSNISVSYFDRIHSPTTFSLNPERTSLLINMKTSTLEQEEIAAMFLEHIKEMSEKFGETSIKDCSITVPNFWTRDTRVKLINSAQIAGLNVLSLVNENTAAAYYYGLDRLDEEKPVHILFYNLGASYLQISLAKYSVSASTSGNSTKTVENVQILAQTFDSTLGGSTFDSVLAEYLADKFEQQHSLNIKDNKKVMTRLFVQANIAKKVLSASRVTLVIVNNIYKGIDFSYNLKREELDSIILAYADRLVAPINDALELGGVSKEDILFLEILGGVSRIPKVQEIIKERLGFDSSTHLNGDESMAHGSVLLAANFSSIVQVKPLWLSDIQLFKVTARFIDSEKKLIEEVVVFEKYSQTGSVYYHPLDYKKNLTVELFEGDELRPLGFYEVSGFENVTVDDYKVIYSFVIDYSSIAFLYKVEAVYMETVQKKVNYTEDDANGPDGSEEGVKDDGEEVKIKEKSKGKIKTKIVPVNETRAISLKHQYFHNGIPRLLTGNEMKEIRNKLAEYKEIEINVKLLSVAKNEFESYIYALTEKLEESLFEAVTIAEERQELAGKVETAKEWMNSDEFSTATYNTIIEKKKELEEAFKQALERESESILREPTISKSRKELKRLEEELLQANQTKSWLPQEEVKLALKTLNDTLDWIQKKSDEQKMLELWKPLVFTSKDIEKRVKIVENQVEKLKRMAKPKEKKPYVPDFMKFDENFDWEKFKEKYGKEKSDDDKDDSPEEAEEHKKHEESEEKAEEKGENAEQTEEKVEDL